MSKKLTFTITAIILALLVPISTLMISKLQVDNTAANVAATRTVELENSAIDYESILNEFENSTLKTEGSLTTFEGYKPIDASVLSEFDNLSSSEVEQVQDTYVKYNFSYDAETNVVTLSAESANGSGEIEVDEISGVAFFTANGEMDALLDVDGETILLSEMQDRGLIQNCGWFKRLFKKVVVAVVAVVVVSAVAAAVVATCGAGLGACIAAGAIAGAVTGAVSGALISYSEYGKLDWRWIVGGAVVGGVIGAVVGWGVGGAVMKTPTTQTNRLINASKKGDLKFSNTVTNHYTSGERPYCNSNQLVQEIMKTKHPIKDPRSATGLKWEVEGVLQTATKGPTKGVWELVVDTKTNTVWHLLFRS